jgi:cellulose synthase/poly-beta-1,6-N-acetylglucosamine synthase-like glycosyltransferase
MIQRGLQVRYAPDAMVYNMGPETLRDFVRQRRRNYAGHLHLKRKYGYRVSSLDNVRVARLALTEVWRAISHTFRLLYVLTALASIELYYRALGSYDYYVRRDKHVVWDMAWTTKEVDQSRVEAAEKSLKPSPEK